jgi:transcription elongation factor Elf1
MSVWIDRKYLLLVSSRLERFAQKKDDLFNFRCPFCGDSKKNKLKARGYVFRKNNDYFYTCHNCHLGTTFSKFLKHIDSHTYSQYALERYSNGENGHSNYTKPNFDLSGPKASEVFSGKGTDLQDNRRESRVNIRNISVPGLVSVDKLEPDHYARKYIEGRKIPEQFWNEVFYTEKYKDFMDTAFPDHGKEDIPNDDRIVLFYTDKEGNITNVTGRALGQSKVRYCTVKITEDKKLFGLHRLQLDKIVYVLEGQFDSFFIENSVASGDSNLGSAAEYLDVSEVVLVYDREPRNKDIVKQINKAIQNDYAVVLFPDTVEGKDINEMILSGMSSEEIMSVMKENTFQGLTAKLKFVDWRKC